MGGRVDRHDVCPVSQMRRPDDHKFVSLAIQNGDLATLGGDIEALCSGVVGQHVGAIADRGWCR